MIVKTSKCFQRAENAKSQHIYILCATKGLHRIVKGNPVKDVPKAVLWMLLSPHKLEQIRVEQCTGSAMHRSKLCFGIWPAPLNLVRMNRWICRIHKVKGMIHRGMVWQISICCPLICDDPSAWEDVPLNNRQECGGWPVFYGYKDTIVCASLNHAQHPMPLSIHVTVVFPMHELRFIW